MICSLVCVPLLERNWHIIIIYKVHLFYKYLLSICCAPGTFLDIGDIAVKETMILTSFASYQFFSLIFFTIYLVSVYIPNKIEALESQGDYDPDFLKLLFY